MKPWQKFSWWSCSIALGAFAGFCGQELIAPAAIFSWKTLYAMLGSGVGIVFVWWLSAIEFEPLRAEWGIRKYLLTSGAIAAFTAFALTVWRFVKH